LAEQILEKVRNAERRAERIGGVGLQAEIAGKETLADQAGDAAEENPGRDKKGGAVRRLSAQSTSSSAAGSRSVPLAFFMRNALMNPSISPSRTRSTSPTCSFVR